MNVKKRAVMAVLTLYALTFSVSGVIYQNIALDTEGFEICYNNVSNCADEVNKSAKTDGVIYLRTKTFDLRVNPVEKFSFLIESIFFPILVLLLTLGVLYAFFIYPHNAIFG